MQLSNYVTDSYSDSTVKFNRFNVVLCLPLLVENLDTNIFPELAQEAE